MHFYHRSLKLDVSFDMSCILQQTVLFVKNLNIEDLLKNKLKFAAITMLNVVLQKQAAFDESTDEEMIIDVCHNVLKSMTKIVKCDDDDYTILFAVDSLCSTCASSSRWNIHQLISLRRHHRVPIETIFVQIFPFDRFCFMKDSREKDQFELKICEKKDGLEICVYNTMMDILVPYVKVRSSGKII